MAHADPEQRDDDYSYAEFEQDCKMFEGIAKERSELFWTCVGLGAVLAVVQTVLKLTGVAL